MIEFSNDNVRPNRTKAKLAQGHTVYGIAIEYGNVQTVEIAASAGCDFITFDMEHEASILPDELAMARAANVSGIRPVVRFAGVQGYIISLIRSATEITDMLHYHPLGKRTAWAQGRTAEFGIGTDFDARSARFNKEIHLHVNVEEKKDAVEDLDNILAHPFVDVIEVGPMDLRLSMGRVPAGEIDGIEERMFARAVTAGECVFELHRGHTLTPGKRSAPAMGQSSAALRRTSCPRPSSGSSRRFVSNRGRVRGRRKLSMPRALLNNIQFSYCPCGRFIFIASNPHRWARSRKGNRT